MGKVQAVFGNGSHGAITRSVDDIVISVKNAYSGEIAFGTPVFLEAGGAVPFNTAAPQEYSSFLGFAVRVADKTPDTYPQDQSGGEQAGTWKPGDVMEVLVRGGITVELAAGGETGDPVYLRKSDGALTAVSGQEGTTVLLENVRIRRPAGAGGRNTEVTVNKRNLI